MGFGRWRIWLCGTKGLRRVSMFGSRSFRNVGEGMLAVMRGARCNPAACVLVVQAEDVKGMEIWRYERF